jgi:peptide/nickel transport system permease protein
VVDVALTDEVGSSPAPGDEHDASRGRRRAWLGLLAAYLVTVFALVTLNFFLPRLMPGDPISALYTAGSATYVQDDSTRQELAAYYGLDDPLFAQYLDYLGNLARGDLGSSIRFNLPVSELIAERLPRTLLLGVTALALGTGVGLLAGAISGWRRGGPLDRRLLAVFLALRGFPVFFLASLALFVFAVKLGAFPVAGASTPFSSLGPLERAGDLAHHLVLPASVLATQFAAGQFLLMRAGMVGELGSDYLLAGRAKGLRQRVLKYRYAGRNALLPVVSLAAIHVGALVGAGLILVETVFAYEGLGSLMFEAISFRDYPALQGAFLVLALVVVSANYLADVLYRRLDPRTTA